MIYQILKIKRCLVQFLRMEFCIQMICHHLKYLGFKFQLNQINRLDTGRDNIFCNCLYTLLCKLMVTISSHIFIYIIQTVHFSAVKFTKGNENNMSFLLIPTFPKVWEKKSKAIEPGTFNGGIRHYGIIRIFWQEIPLTTGQSGRLTLKDWFSLLYKMI